MKHVFTNEWTKVVAFVRIFLLEMFKLSLKNFYMNIREYWRNPKQFS